nr:MAG TPA: hypothetical protein [Caudoviricetes sp.]DAL49357.1 MAG TPA_asm: hypothetical protein [Caudoviricetes sp.]DAM82834.1 MAG TPA: hypothetical protein [Caudoviricetes sp.]DAQ95246.1 MAG TPA: hypothetical protein [Caudoviricetes sp.]DAZ48181.1 MAG TPA: hypothetical protein [Caudoviricetes sp.]
MLYSLIHPLPSFHNYINIKCSLSQQKLLTMYI